MHRRTDQAKKIKAKEYWDEIIENAWENAEPGLFFWDRVTSYDPSHVYDKFKILRIIFFAKIWVDNL